MVVNEYNMPQTRLPTNNPEFQHSGTRIRTTTLTNTWSHSWSTIRPMTRLAVTDAKLRSWVDFAIHLATDMEGSPADYAIRQESAHVHVSGVVAVPYVCGKDDV
jgi:hypothetical protein